MVGFLRRRAEGPARLTVHPPAGNRLGEANGASNSVAPGQSANAQLIGSGAKGVVQCTVANVNRYPS